MSAQILRLPTSDRCGICGGHEATVTAAYYDEDGAYLMPVCRECEERTRCADPHCRLCSQPERVAPCQ